MTAMPSKIRTYAANPASATSAAARPPPRDTPAGRKRRRSAGQTPAREPSQTRPAADWPSTCGLSISTRPPIGPAGRSDPCTACSTARFRPVLKLPAQPLLVRPDAVSARIAGGRRFASWRIAGDRTNRPPSPSVRGSLPGVETLASERRASPPMSPAATTPLGAMYSAGVTSPCAAVWIAGPEPTAFGAAATAIRLNR